MKEIVIKLEDRVYEHAINGSQDSYDEADAFEAIRKGVTLSEGHGDLIDRSKLQLHERDVQDGNTTRLMDVYLPGEIISAPTVVAADNSEKRSDEEFKRAYAWCEDCDHIEMCRWHPYEGCEFRSLPKDSSGKDMQWIWDGIRKPELGETVLVTFSGAVHYAIYKNSDEQHEYPVFCVMGKQQVILKLNEVEAWMHLPDPYKIRV